jgi:hypothetical protein
LSFLSNTYLKGESLFKETVETDGERGDGRKEEEENVLECQCFPYGDPLRLSRWLERDSGGMLKVGGVHHRDDI